MRGVPRRQSVAAAGYCAGRPLTPTSRRPALPAVEAHITGTVWKIECAVGDTIAEGDTVAILESMKMEMPVEAEDAGTVKEILCEEGQAVSEGDTLIVLE
jgi:acetyl-CoA carboxylase biotin carboxyl carrier protein